MSTSSNAPLRLFILGIGGLVSSDVCEGLANAGGGKYLLAFSPESILPQCTGLLRAGRTSTVTDVSVDWTADMSPDHDPSPKPTVQQSPPKLIIPEVYPFSRSLYLAIISTETVPKQVIIQGKADGKEVLIRVDVESAKFGRRFSDPPFIHTLAAHRLIRDLENGDAKGKHSETDLRREIVELGEYYQLASSHTSFVAVDYGEVYPSRQNQQKSPNLSTTVTSLVGAFWKYLTDPTSLFRSSTVSDRPKQGYINGLPGGWSSPEGTDSGASEPDTDYSDSSEDHDEWASQDSNNSFSTLSSLESYSSVDSIRPPRRPRRSSSQRRRDRDSLPQAPYAPPPPISLTSNEAEERFKPLPISPDVATLVQQMSTSGSFTLSDALSALVGRAAVEEARSWDDEELAATALAMAYLEKNLGDHLEVCQLLTEKGMEFVRNHPNGGKFSELLDNARAIIFRPVVV